MARCGHGCLKFQDLPLIVLFRRQRDKAEFEGLFRLDLYRRPGEVETEFMTLMWFTDQEAIIRFAGPDWETAVVRAPARAMLSRFDEKAAHYELRVAKEAAPRV